MNHPPMSAYKKDTTYVSVTGVEGTPEEPLPEEPPEPVEIPAAYVVVTRPTAQPISNANQTDINFTSSAVIEAHTSDGMFSTALPSRITIKRSGMYIATANVMFASNANGYRMLRIRVGTKEIARLSIPGRAASTMLSASGVFYAAYGAIVTFSVEQTSGAALDMTEARAGVVLL
jgi:hypothetical protein